VVDYFGAVREVPDPGWVNHFFRGPVMVYALVVLVAWRAWGRVAASRSGGPGKPGPVLAKLTGLSFTVYLIHPMLLRAMKPTFLDLWFLPKLMVLVVAAFGVAWLLDRLLRGKWLRMLVGL
jgi:peptidoglycan/LPS O-acetylase OafA/YrhL